MKIKKLSICTLLLLLVGCNKGVVPIALEKNNVHFLRNTILEATPTPTPTATPTSTPDVAEEARVTSDSTEVFSEDSVFTAPAEASTGYSGRPYGSAGRIRIPVVGIDTALYWVTIEPTTLGSPASGQNVVDAYDSAAYMDFNGYAVIGDHAEQGFGGIIGLSPGTEIFIDNTDGTTTIYHVYASFPSDNTDGMLMYNGAFSYDGINLYTCTDSVGNNVWVLQAN